MLSVINVQRIVGVRDSSMRITARNIGQLPRRKLGKLGVKRNSESAVYNYAQSSALPRSGSPAFISSYAFHRAIDGLKKKRWIREREGRQASKEDGLERSHVATRRGLNTLRMVSFRRTGATLPVRLNPLARKTTLPSYSSYR
ncbi:hypothetical protein G5I_11950 [Acromyrmex echinatior]|uniref:Uncharacterized protein n=1 Tax=Acromyrmex echinatior TaxID=103372 RepID=F4X0Z6_ACREC|nr:hypothetical protein G5I_11950 [Acromyrmex echinatior]